MTPPSVAARTTGPVRIVGAGLLGASIGLALRALGVDVILADISPAASQSCDRLRRGRRAAADDSPRLDCRVRSARCRLPRPSPPSSPPTRTHSSRMSRASSSPRSANCGRIGADISRYVGSHPMAGRERGGAISARADLFVGRPWVIANHDGIADRRAADSVLEALALDLGAAPVEMDAAEHDRSVALVSHVPQVISSLLAARLIDCERCRCRPRRAGSSRHDAYRG